MTAADEGGTGPVIRDNRRIDPATGQPRRGKHAANGPGGPSGSGRSGGGGGGQHRKGSNTAREAAANAKSEEAAASTAASAAAKASASKEAEDLKTQLAERTADLQRLQAEYTNYRKRVDRDRATVRELAIASALNELLPVLDAIGQAREHGELSGGFKSVADSLQAAMSKLGLVSYGERRRVRPKDPRGSDEQLLAGRHGGDLRRDLPAGLQDWRADPPPGQGGGCGARHRAGRRLRYAWRPR